MPNKSLAVALLFTIFFGPLGLLYATFWGGVIMIVLGIIVACSKFLFPAILVWLICCAWSVKAIERYQKKTHSQNLSART
ncbi:MAG: hypothetical protein ACD_60C00111G0002 [uncultured bacterium]|nr:MAG: hypothetical protein ACD_60C00111G0002 [uncultured bacterium]